MRFLRISQNIKIYKATAKSWRLMLFTFIICCFIPTFAMGQGYYNEENFGNRSILLSGNVTGSVDDLGLTYYNPSRLALIDEPNFTINAKAYQMGSIKIENVFGRSNKLSDSKFGGLPSLVAGTFKIGKIENHKFAYAILSRKKSSADVGFSREYEGTILEDYKNVDRFIAELNLRDKEFDEWFGASWATKLSENFGIGVSTFVSVYEFNGSYEINYSRLDTESDVAAYNNEINFGQNSYGIFWKIGLAWKLPKLDIGLNVDIPYIDVYSTGRLEFKEVLAGIGEGEDIFEYADWNELESKRKEPLGIAFGAGVPLGKNTIHLKVDWHGKQDEYSRLDIPTINDSGELVSFAFKEELRSVVNVGLGADFSLGSKLNLYASAATDFSPIVTNANIFDLIAKESKDINFDANFFHFGLGLQLKMDWAQLVLGATYSTATAVFERPVDFPDPEVDIPTNDDPAKIVAERWRFIIGLEIPILGHKIEIK